MDSKPRYDISTQYISQGKRKDVCTVIDILTTYNSNNEIVNIKYISAHDFLGQTVYDYDVPESTIARGILT